MKNIVLILLLSFNYGFAQEVLSPVISIMGIKPIAVEVDGKSSEEIYSSVKKWVLQSYKNPEEVLKVDLPNEQIRVNGYKPSMYSGYGLGNREFPVDVEYSLIIDIKEGRYRFSFEIIKEIGSDWMSSRPITIFFKKDGSIRKGAEPQIKSMNNSLSLMNMDIYNAIMGNSKDEW